MLKTCLQCGSAYKTYYSKSKYCGKSCQNASQVKAATYTCAHCGTSFQRPNHVIKKAANLRFCSHQCHIAWKQSARTIANCITCGQEFFPDYPGRKACSWECRNAALVTSVNATCEHCGKSYKPFASAVKRGRRFCSADCAHDAMVGNSHPNYKGGRWMKHGRRWQAVRRLVLNRDKVCRWCGAERSPSGRELSVHHIKPRRDYLIVDIANELDNLVTLCAPCHQRVEMWVTHGRTAELPIDLRPRE